MFSPIASPDIPASSGFFLLTLNNRLILIPRVLSEENSPQIYDGFDQNWTALEHQLPKKVIIQMHFAIDFNKHVLVGRRVSGKIRKAVNVFVHFRDDVICTEYTTRSTYLPSLGHIVAQSRNSVYVIDQRLSSQPGKHFRLDFSNKHSLNLHRWAANRLLLDLFQTQPKCVALNKSSLITASLPSLFGSFSLSNYFQIKELFADRDLRSIRLVSSVSTQRSLEISLPELKFGLIPNLSDTFNFTNAKMITLSNGLVFVSGGHQKSSFKAINNCCLLKVTDAHDRPKRATPDLAQVPSMLLISNNNLATVENLTSPKKSPDWMGFSQIQDFLLDPSTPVVAHPANCR